VLLFVLAVNPLSALLKKCQGYMLGSAKERKINVTHTFFVDDLKLYSGNIHDTKGQLELVTTFSRDIGMEFGQDKCSYLVVNRGKIVDQTGNMDINGLSISPISELMRMLHTLVL
jgi:hypothetical protein